MTAAENLFVCSTFKNGPSAHQASYSVDNEGLFPPKTGWGNRDTSSRPLNPT